MLGKSSPNRKKFREKIYNKIEKGIMEHWGKALIIFSGAMFLIPTLILGVMAFVDYKIDGKLPDSPTRLGLDVWLTIYISVISIIVSGVVGIVALRFSVKVDLMSRRDQFLGLEIKKIKLYDLERDFCPSAYVHTDYSKRYLMKLECSSIDSMYDIKLKCMEWGLIGSDYVSKEFATVENVELYCTQQSELSMYLYFDDYYKNTEGISKGEEEKNELKKSFRYYYRMTCYETVINPSWEKQRSLRLRLLLTDHSGIGKSHRQFELELTAAIQNVGYHEGAVILEMKHKDCRISNSVVVWE